MGGPSGPTKTQRRSGRSGKEQGTRLRQESSTHNTHSRAFQFAAWSLWWDSRSIDLCCQVDDVSATFALIMICLLSGPKPSSAASPHTPQSAVLFVDSEFASVSTYNVQGPCGADQTTIPRPPVTPPGAWQLHKHQAPYIKHKQNSQRQYSPDTPLYRFSSSVSTVTRLQTRRPKSSGVRIPEKARDFSLLQNVQTGSGAHPASYSLGTGVLHRVKAVRTWCRQVTSA